MNEEYSYQTSRGLSIIIVFIISLIVSFIVTFFSFYYIFPELEIKYLSKYVLVKVPDLRGLSISKANNILSNINLQYEIIEYQESDLIPKGNIIQQYPLPNSLVKRKSLVSLIISKGPSVIKVPNLKLKSLNEVKKILNDLNLQLGEIKNIENTEVDEGLVVYTEPQFGSEVKKDTKINIFISKKKKDVSTKIQSAFLQSNSLKIKVPSVINRSLKEAKKILESSGLVLGNVKKVCDEDKDFNIIISQFPKAGSFMVKGSKVDVVLNCESQ